MSVLNELLNHNRWLEFLNFKDSFYINEDEYNFIKDFIENKKYYETSKKIVDGTYEFSIPRKKFINKSWTTKKRIVYTFKYNEMIIFKMIQYLLFEYDYLLSSNCYSFRRNIGPKQAFYDITKDAKLGYGYKVDIHNYFNSISIPKLLKILKNNIDNKMYQLFENILSNDYVYINDKLSNEKKGVMAGTPTSCFLSNVYLADLDKHFLGKKYARYADDIIIFAETKEELENMINYIHNYFKEHELEINNDKEHYYLPGDSFEFLGFSYNKGVIDLSQHAILKMKAKIRRKARALRRWKLRKNVSSISAMKAMNNIFNYKFFYDKKNKELNWSIWYFPVINTVDSLAIIDKYFQQYLRFIVTGKHHGKKYYSITYAELKKAGYRSLVHEYYIYKKKH